MFEQPIRYWSKHVILSNISHAVGGFGLALLLQQYLVGNPFWPPIVGWAAIIFAIVTHLVAFTSKSK